MCPSVPSSLDLVPNKSWFLWPSDRCCVGAAVCSDLKGLADKQNPLDLRAEGRKEGRKAEERRPSKTEKTASLSREGAKENDRAHRPVAAVCERRTLTSSSFPQVTLSLFAVRKLQGDRLTGSGWTWVWRGHFEMSDQMVAGDICQAANRRAGKGPNHWNNWHFLSIHQSIREQWGDSDGR